MDDRFTFRQPPDPMSSTETNPSNNTSDMLFGVNYPISGCPPELTDLTWNPLGKRCLQVVRSPVHHDLNYDAVLHHSFGSSIDLSLEHMHAGGTALRSAATPSTRRPKVSPTGFEPGLNMNNLPYSPPSADEVVDQNLWKIKYAVNFPEPRLRLIDHHSYSMGHYSIVTTCQNQRELYPYEPLSAYTTAPLIPMQTYATPAPLDSNICTVQPTNDPHSFIFRCAFPHCHVKTYARWSDFYRHYNGAHAPEKTIFFSPVVECHRSVRRGNRGFPRKDKMRTHVAKMHGGEVVDEDME
jgi:hypothetical protein